jgi:hypothetical protein
MRRIRTAVFAALLILATIGAAVTPAAATAVVHKPICITSPTDCP